MKISINLTIHQKELLLPKILDGIFNNINHDFEFIAVLDNCSDNSEDILFRYLGKQKNKYLREFNVLFADNLYETKCNNMAAKASHGDYIIIVQDDCQITEMNFDQRMLKPFLAFPDVAAVTANCAHNWMLNENSIGKTSDGWSDKIFHIHHANKNNTDRNTFAVRDCVNRGPLMIKKSDLISIGYFNEDFCPQDSDDHNACYDLHRLGKVVGYYGIDFISDPLWGGTRENGVTKQWMLDANIKNAALLWERNKDIMHNHVNENRILC